MVLFYTAMPGKTEMVYGDCLKEFIDNARRDTSSNLVIEIWQTCKTDSNMCQVLIKGSDTKLSIDANIKVSQLCTLVAAFDNKVYSIFFKHFQCKSLDVNKWKQAVLNTLSTIKVETLELSQFHKTDSDLPFISNMLGKEELVLLIMEDCYFTPDGSKLFFRCLSQSKVVDLYMNSCLYHPISTLNFCDFSYPSLRKLSTKCFNLEDVLPIITSTNHKLIELEAILTGLAEQTPDPEQLKHLRTTLKRHPTLERLILSYEKEDEMEQIVII